MRWGDKIDFRLVRFALFSCQVFLPIELDCQPNRFSYALQSFNQLDAES